MGRIVRKRTQQKSKIDKVKPTPKAAGKLIARPKATKKRTGTKTVKLRSARQVELTVSEFRSIVNIPSKQLERWLNTIESQKLQFADEPAALNGKNGESIISLLKKRKEKYAEADIEQMENVIQFVKQRLAKRPKGNIVASNWRYSLMNWGHDPTKKLRRAIK